VTSFKVPSQNLLGRNRVGSKRTVSTHPCHASDSSELTEQCVYISHVTHMPKKLPKQQGVGILLGSSRAVGFQRLGGPLCLLLR
jgi:hypothetical protein